MSDATIFSVGMLAGVSLVIVILFCVFCWTAHEEEKFENEHGEQQ